MSIQDINTTSSRNHYLDVARGLRPDCSTFYLFGFNRSVDTAYETIWNDGGGVYVPPSSAVTLSLVSDDAADTMDVEIIGLDAQYRQISDTVTLDGTNAVTSNVDFFRINSARILSGSNAGDITISNGGTTYGFIEVGYGVTQTIHYTVPAGRSLYVTQVDFTSGTVNSNKYLFARAKSVNGGVTQHFFESTFVTSQLSYDMQVPFRLPEKTDFSIQAKSSSGSNELSIFINGILIDN
jgi:hypothetical protein